MSVGEKGQLQHIKAFRVNLKTLTEIRKMWSVGHLKSIRHLTSATSKCQ